MEHTLLLREILTLGTVFLFSYLVSYMTIPVIIRAAERNHFFDHPDESRKLHSEAIPTLGGIAIFLSFLLAFSMSPWADVFEGFSYLVSALLILFFVGMKDDLFVLAAKKKLVAQIAAAALVVFGSNVLISNFHGVLGFSAISNWLAIPITFFTIVVVINAVNLIDGIDGLAGSFGAMASTLFGITFLYTGQLPMAMFSFCLAGGLLGFLYYNFSPAAIFMGDTGSMLLGFLLSIQAIKFIGLGSNVAFSTPFGNSAPILAVAVLALPLYDTLRVVIKRYRRNNGIFDPGQDHIHHELLRMGISHKSASLLLTGLSLLLVMATASLALAGINVNVQLGAFIIGCVLIFPTNGTKRKLFSMFFGYDWDAYRNRKWGFELADTQPESTVKDIPEDAPLERSGEREKVTDKGGTKTLTH